MVQSSAPATLRLGTRGSALALAQARMTQERLVAAHGLAPEAVQICVIRTTGDRIQDRSLAESGGKGLFTKELEEALLAGDIDFAVHSSKDMPTVLPEGLALVACLEREDPRDVLVSRVAKSFADLRRGARLGTSSLRRQAMAKRLRPDLQVDILRGNVETRLSRIEAGDFDATLLALAGLRRLGLEQAATAILDTHDFLPAVGQGAIVIEARENDERIRQYLAAINHPVTTTALTAERAFLAVLDGSCRTPIAGHAEIDGSRIRFRGMILKPDGSECHETMREGSVADAAALGADAGAELKRRGGADFFVRG
jgi:hydroxymethylbilane synthase